MFSRITFVITFLAFLFANITLALANGNAEQGYISVRANLLKGANAGRCNAFNIIGTMLIGNIPLDDEDNPLLAPISVAEECTAYGVMLDENLVEVAENIAIIEGFILVDRESHVQFIWTSIEESEIDFYVVERSDDDINYFVVTGVSARGDGSAYFETDSPDRPGIYRYRLRAGFNDGSFSEVLGSETIILP